MGRPMKYQTVCSYCGQKAGGIHTGNNRGEKPVMKPMSMAGICKSSLSPNRKHNPVWQMVL